MSLVYLYRLMVITSIEFSLAFGIWTAIQKAMSIKNVKFNAAVIDFFLLFQPLTITLAMLSNHFPKCTMYFKKIYFLVDSKANGFNQHFLNENAVSTIEHKILLCSDNLTSMKILSIVWLTVALALAFSKLYTYFRYKTFLKRNIIRELKRNDSRICFISSQIAASPFLIGIFKPVIYLPDIETDNDELNLIIAHENAHCRRLDCVKKAYAMFLKCLNWYNPLFYYLFDKSDEITELIVDEAVVDGASYQQRKKYGNILLRYAKLNADSARTEICSLLSRNANKLERRLNGIMNTETKKTRKFTATFIITLLTIILVLGVSYIVKSQSPDNYNYIADVGKKLSDNIYIPEDGEFFPQCSMYALGVENTKNKNVMQNLAYGNGEVIVINSEEDGFYFEENQQGTIRISADLSKENSNVDGRGELLEIGYIFNGYLAELYDGRIDEKELSVEFCADKSGNYQFYVCNASAGMQNYHYITIEK